MIMQVNPFIQYQGAVLPTRLAVGELNKRLKGLLHLRCPSCIKDLIVQGHKYLKEPEEEAVLHGAFYLATAYELYCALKIRGYKFDQQALDEYLDSLEKKLENDETLLHYFAALENLSIFIYLFAERQNTLSYLNVLAGKTAKETPLHVAAMAGNIPIVQFLLDRGADVRKFDSCQNSALHHACQSQKDCVDIVKLLLQYDPVLMRAKNSAGQTPLHLSAFMGNAKSLEYLLVQIADPCEVDLQDMEGNTSLHLAVIGEGISSNQPTADYVKIIAALVKKGANLNILNHNRKTALALIFENAAIINVIVEENLSPQMLVSFLQNYYLSQNTLSIFRIKMQQEWELKVPLEEIYVRLGIIENKERKTRDQALNKHSEYLQDARIPAYESIFEPKQNIEIEKLFQHKSLKKKARKRVFIQGAAGIGKSTLCHYTSYYWAKGKLWAGMFACLFRIPLRNLTLRKYPDDKEYAPASMIAKEYGDKIDHRVIEACINDAAFLQNTLLVLDGYDELPAEAQANTSLAAAFKQLKELFPHILVTSRPGSYSFERSCELELLGFDKKGVGCYVNRFFKQVQAEEKKQKLNRLLATSPQILSLAHIPINLSLLCCLFNEDPQVFDTEQSITMSAIYARVVNWMYKWFLLRRIDQGISKQTKEQILTEKNLRQNKEVAKIAKAFEKMADFAMENDTLYLSKQEIEDFRGKKILPNEITDCGLMRIPEVETEAEEKGYFIHLTFQEFLTASKVANQYLKGERQTCQEFLQNYKFEPRYALVLRMIAGCLSFSTSSNRRYADAFQSFFDDLFAAPQDLAVSNELTLIAACFEECQDPKMVKQYDDFIELVKDYIKHLCLLGLDVGRLLNNKNLLNHPKIVLTIEELLSDPKTKKNMLSILLSMVRAKVSLASEILGLIVEELKSPKKDSDSQRYAIEVLREVGRQGDELPKEALAVLIQVLKESDRRANKAYAASALREIVKRGDEPFKAALNALIQAFQEGDRMTKIFTARALRAIAQRGDKLSKEVLHALIQALKESDRMTSAYAVNTLVEIVKQGGKLSKEALNALIQAFKEGKEWTKRALWAITKQGGELSKEALATLTQALQEGEEWDKNSAVEIIEAITKQGSELFKEELVALAQTLKERDRGPKISAARTPAAIARQGNELPKEVLAALTQALRKNDRGTQASATRDLEAIAQREDGLPKEVLAALTQALVKSDRGTQASATRALEAIAQRGDELPKEVLAALTQALRKNDRGTQASAARALEAIAQRGDELPKEVLAALIQALQEGEEWTKYLAARVLETIANQGNQLPEEGLVALIQALKEGDRDAKGSAARALGVMTKQGDELSKKALDALIQALEEGEEWAKTSAAHALGEIAKQRGELPKEALDGLIQSLKEGEEWAKTSAARALGEIAKQGGELPKEALSALIQVLKEGDGRIKSFAAAALKKVDKNALLKMGAEAFALTAEACFFTENTFSVKVLQPHITDKKTAYLSKHTLKLSYEKIREKLPTELSEWRKRLDILSITGSSQSPADRT
ncbi:HEAT repeat domain-containing protein [Parachlamydia sp. AcF125]|uniref:HEAT repeat domain-containing protein n=1 Tax=Parachlamydia sp. AcF125 TaxID=2795736 RepID=UPI001BCA006C|nr:HEAT repeat domain-containing protein [Parachlamydia sp. AcF125]MBS4169293.1 Phosphocholine transferase AnkX [Parachlamydia sp. AcF125]